MTPNFKHPGALLAAIGLVLLYLLGSPLQAKGPETALTAADTAQVRSAVQNQLAAFAKDDAGGAFLYAAPNIRKTFGTAAAFLDMVRRSYPVVYRPASTAFLVVEGAGNFAVQRVQMQDAAGKTYLATYTLERVKAKTWRITGCEVALAKGQTA